MAKTETKNTEALLMKALREISGMRRELKAIGNLINADVRTADRLISVREACGILGWKKSKIYDMIKRGELPARSENGRHMRVSFNEIQKYIHS